MKTGTHTQVPEIPMTTQNNCFWIINIRKHWPMENSYYICSRFDTIKICVRI